MLDGMARDLGMFLPPLLEGAVKTMQLTAVSFLLAVAIGLVVCFCRLSGYPAAGLRGGRGGAEHQLRRVSRRALPRRAPVHRDRPDPGRALPRDDEPAGDTLCRPPPGVPRRLPGPRQLRPRARQ